MSETGSAPSERPAKPLPGEPHIGGLFLLLLIVVCGVAGFFLALTDNMTIGLVALTVLLGATLVWVVAAAIGAASSGHSLGEVLWMSFKNFFRILFNFWI